MEPRRRDLMVKPEGAEDPLPDRKAAWTAYNTRVAEIRARFSGEQKALRKTLDDKAAEAHKEYDRQLENLRNWLNDELAAARREHASTI